MKKYTKRMEKEMKKLGYGVVTHFNQYSGKFEIYKLGDHDSSKQSHENEKVVTNKSLKKASKKYIKLFLKK